MALTKSLIHSSNTGPGFGTGVYTTASMTVPDDCLLVVLAYMMQNGGAGDPTGSLTVAKTGGGATFTARGNTGGVVGWAIGVKAWTAPVTTGGSWTLELDCGALNADIYGIAVYAFTGYDTGTPVGATASDASGGANGAFATLTLSGTPAASSYVLSVIGTHGPDAGTGPLVGSGWTDDYGYASAGDHAFRMQSKTGHTSTSVPWDDVCDGGADCGDSSAIALEILAAADTPPITDGPALVSVRSNIRFN